MAATMTTTTIVRTLQDVQVTLLSARNLPNPLLNRSTTADTDHRKTTTANLPRTTRITLETAGTTTVSRNLKKTTTTTITTSLPTLTPVTSSPTAENLIFRHRIHNRPTQPAPTGITPNPTLKAETENGS